MDIGTFAERLRKLNPKLYVDFNHRIYSTSSEGTSGIYLRDHHPDKIDAMGCGATSTRGAEEESSSDLYVGWTQHGYVPEGDIFEGDRLKAQGWRAIVKRLIASGKTTKRKAERVFGYTESWYDRLNYDQRLEFFRKDQCHLPQL